MVGNTRAPHVYIFDIFGEWGVRVDDTTLRTGNLQNLPLVQSMKFSYIKKMKVLNYFFI